MGSLVPFDRLTKEREEYNLATEFSRARRKRWQRLRMVQRALVIPAVAGAALLVYYVTLPMPVDNWPIGLTGGLLMLPWLIAINERID